VFHLIVTLTARTAEEIPMIKAAVEQMRPMCLDEPGCVSWDAYHSTADPRVFTLVEAWEDEQSWDEHGEVEAIQTISCRRSARTPSAPYTRVDASSRTRDLERARSEPGRVTTNTASHERFDRMCL